jgi:hypothetical protein
MQQNALMLVELYGGADLAVEPASYVSPNATVEATVPTSAPPAESSLAERIMGKWTKQKMATVLAAILSRLGVK